MKTLSFYLLSIAMLFIVSCQKDIGENELQSKEKKDKCCKCKDVLFLPEELSVSSKYLRNRDTLTSGTEHYKFTYENDQGDLKSIIITSPYGQKDTILFTYHNGLLDTVINLHTSYNQYSTFSKFNYVNNQIDTREEFIWNNKYDPDSIKISSLGTVWFTWSGTKLSSYFYDYDGKLLIEYDLDSIKSIKTERTPGYNWGYSTYWGDRYYTSNNKNYWAKNIKNKEILLFRVPFLTAPSEFDITKVVAIIDDSDAISSQRTEVFLFNNKYNDACYPIEINETHLFKGQWVLKTTKIKYKKVPKS